MNLSTKKVEQILSNTDVVIDYSEILTPSEINGLLINSFPNSSVKNGNVYACYNKNDYCIFAKNVSYLGNPHPIYKKRIQIPESFKDLYEQNNLINVKTLLLGVYKYKEVILFCDFETSTYVKNKMNNSSAHVFTIDLKKGIETGFFEKNDYRGNKIIIFTKERINDYLKYKFDHTEIECKIEIFNTFDRFFESVPKKWDGIQCYKEMINNNYNNKYQSEWSGFYLEFLMSRFITEHNLYNIIRYEQNKKTGEIDLDLYFSKIDSYGDLKMHSNTSLSIIGNDYDTIEELVKKGKVYYIVCNMVPEMDRDYDYEVTNFWNKIQNKENVLSYSNKMKHNVHLFSYYILEINKFNYIYLDVFNQGKNSDGGLRKPKISISNKNLGNFLIHMVEFKEDNEG